MRSSCTRSGNTLRVGVAVERKLQQGGGRQRLSGVAAYTVAEAVWRKRIERHTDCL